MGVENKILNLFLHKKGRNKQKRVWMGYNSTNGVAYSYQESLKKGGDGPGGTMNIGLLSIGSEELSNLIRIKLEEMHFDFPPTRLLFHNEGNYQGGRRVKLPENMYWEIYDFLNKNKPKFYFEPEVFRTS